MWGVITVNAGKELPPDTEQRLEKFTELVTTAIANAEGKSELAASRRRIVAASDDARRRIERDLHDGVQQQLVSLTLKLAAMEAELPAADALEEQLASLRGYLGSVLEGLVEIARGIHPAILSQGGLGAALQGLARRSAVPVELDGHIESPLLDEVEVAAYYVVSAALYERRQVRTRVHGAHRRHDGRWDPNAGGPRRRRRRGRSGQGVRARRVAGPGRGARRHDHDRQFSGKRNLRCRHTPGRHRGPRRGDREPPRSATRAGVAHESSLRERTRPTLRAAT